MENEVRDKAAKEPLTKKQLLNNHIVLMRKVVRKARVHVINKLTKEAKKLKDRKGAEKAQEKAKRKADRLVQEIQTIKHLREDKISIYALQDKTKVEEILQNPQSTTENRALARLSHNQLIQAEVQKYRTVNPHWDLQIPVLLERNKDKRRKINKKLAEREASKTNKIPVQPRPKSKSETDIEAKDKFNSPSHDENDEGEEEHNDNSHLQSDSDSPGSCSDSGEDEKAELNRSHSHNSESESEEEESGIDSDTQEQEVEKTSKSKKESVPKPKSKQPTKVEVKLSTPTSTHTPLEKPVPALESESSTPATKNNKKDKKKAKPIAQDIGKSVGTVKVQFLKDLADLEGDDDPRPVILTAEDPESVARARPKPRSSFFVGGVDEEPEPEREKRPPGPGRAQVRQYQRNQNQTGSEEFKPIFRKGKLVNKGPGPKRFPPPDRNRNSRNQNHNQRYFDKEDCNLIPLGNKSSRPDKPSLLQKPVYDSISGPSSATEKLHPSWEAKKRQQPTLSEFKGKKIKFSDDD